MVCGGIQVRNKKGEVVMWFKGKDPKGTSSFALCMYRPELADPETHEKLEQAFELAKSIARGMNLPLFDIREIARELNRMEKELGQPNAIGSEKGEDVTLSLTEVNTGRRCRLTIGVTKGRHPDVPP
jgi:hypothetical protein